MEEANLKQNPETLFKCKRGTNLCFYTPRGGEWKNAFYIHYIGRVTERDIQDALQLHIEDLEDKKKRHLTVNIFHTGKVVVQGRRTVITTFENETFQLLKEIV